MSGVMKRVRRIRTPPCHIKQAISILFSPLPLEFDLVLKGDRSSTATVLHYSHRHASLHRLKQAMRTKADSLPPLSRVVSERMECTPFRELHLIPDLFACSFDHLRTSMTVRLRREPNDGRPNGRQKAQR